MYITLFKHLMSFVQLGSEVLRLLDFKFLATSPFVQHWCKSPGELKHSARNIGLQECHWNDLIRTWSDWLRNCGHTVLPIHCQPNAPISHPANFVRAPRYMVILIEWPALRRRHFLSEHSSSYVSEKQNESHKLCRSRMTHHGCLCTGFELCFDSSQVLKVSDVVH